MYNEKIEGCSALDHLYGAVLVTEDVAFRLFEVEPLLSEFLYEIHRARRKTTAISSTIYEHDSL